MAKATKQVENVEIMELERNYLTAYMVGITPMLCNRFSKKAREQLLLPAPKMNAVEKSMNLKHDPVAEFRESVCMNRSNREPAALHVPEGAIKKALANAALDMPGAKKSQIGRLASLTSTQINLFGLPRLSMKMVRQSDMNRTPDVRTRAQFDRWACSVEIGYMSLLKEGQIVALLAAAGMIVGIGDNRPQKGGDFGQFRICEPDDEEYVDITTNEGRKAQLAAPEHPVAADPETEELLAWYNQEVKRREKHVPSSGPAPEKTKRGRQALAEAAE